jgi:hypothetical protein
MPAWRSISGGGCCVDRPGKTLGSTGICVGLQASLIGPPGADHGPRLAQSEPPTRNARNRRKTTKKKRRRDRFQIEKSEEDAGRKDTFKPADLRYFQIGDHTPPPAQRNSRRQQAQLPSRGRQLPRARMPNTRRRALRTLRLLQRRDACIGRRWRRPRTEPQFSVVFQLDLKLPGNVGL